MYGFKRARELDGTLHKGSREGSYCLTAARVIMGWGTVVEERWPMPKGTVDWPPLEPPGLDNIARFNRHFSHWKVRDLDDMRRAIYARAFFNFSVSITKQWRTAHGGMIQLPETPSEFVEGHAMAAVGYDDNRQLIKFINNWGPHWGDQGFGYLPYAYFERHCTDALTTFPAKMKNWRPTDIYEPFGLRTAMFTNALGYAGTVIDLWDINNDIRIGWCLMTFRGEKWVEIEDFFIRPDFQDDDVQTALTEAVFALARDNELPVRLWIAHADTTHYSSNFKVIKNLLRAKNWQVRPSPHTWAAYVADQI